MYITESYSELVLELTRVKNIVAICCLLFSYSSSAQEIDESIWEGNWVADGTLFQIQVEVENGIMKLHQVESMGFIWTSTDGEVDGNILRVEVEYAGVTGIVQAELVDNETAVAFAATCVPDFMVVCALAKDRQAVFIKQANN